MTPFIVFGSSLSILVSWIYMNPMKEAGSRLIWIIIICVALIPTTITPCVLLIMYEDLDDLRPRHPLSWLAYIFKVFFRSIYLPISVAAFGDLSPSEKQDFEIETLQQIGKSQSEWWWIERLAKAFQRDGNLSAATENWERLGDLLPNDWWQKYQLAQAYERQEDLNAAIIIWEKLLINQVPCAEWWATRLEAAVRRNGGRVAVVTLWRKLLKDHSNRVGYLRRLLRASSPKRAPPDSLIAAYEAEITKDSESLESAKILAKVYAEFYEDYKEAFSVWKWLLNKRSNDSIVEKELAKMYVKVLTYHLLLRSDCVKKRLAALSESEVWMAEGQALSICSTCDEYLCDLSIHTLEVVQREVDRLLNGAPKWTRYAAIFCSLISVFLHRNRTAIWCLLIPFLTLLLSIHLRRILPCLLNQIDRKFNSQAAVCPSLVFFNI